MTPIEVCPDCYGEHGGLERCAWCGRTAPKLERRDGRWFCHFGCFGAAFEEETRGAVDPENGSARHRNRWARVRPER